MKDDLTKLLTDSQNCWPADFVTTVRSSFAWLGAAQTHTGLAMVAVKPEQGSKVLHHSDELTIWKVIVTTNIMAPNIDQLFLMDREVQTAHGFGKSGGFVFFKTVYRKFEMCASYEILW